ncbi:restriction endonuclease subunit S [Xanthomonas campestris pv. asclepiadis]|uniref:restriction endonuclease subunit S n=1 Tax=Xanthomonas campestris TaxID=339 RepID=UPI001E2EDBFC|nr:restriction endonuclease subunit S [Xanthomonas campestris]MCC4617993.1 restriction endonuclease subunit S [Xanthomonas campestris pv. asclepiadis]
MSELPVGWVKATLSEVGHIVTGKTPDTKRGEFYGGNFPFIRPGDLNQPKDIFETETCLTELGAKQIPTIPEGSVVVTCIGNLGKVGLTTKPSATNQQINSIIPFHGVDPRFLFHYAKILRLWLEENSSATTIAIVNKGTFSEAPILIPPKQEQKRIAQKLDALLAQVDTLKARIDAIPALLKRFRSSIVESATRGSLTSDWRTLNSTTDWVKTVIGELLKEKPRNGYSPKPVDYETKTRSLSLSATTSGKFRPEFSKFIAETIPSGSHLWLEPGDILIQRANTLEYVGVSALFDGQTGNFIYPDLMMKCRAKPSVAPAFLQLVLNSKSVRKYFRDNATGTAGNMPKINQHTVVSAPVVLPMIEEQTEIVRRVEQLFAYADQLEAKVAAAKQRIDALTQSLLAKAFRGELVPQEPSDEPASVLLERIRTQRAAMPKPKRGRKAATS